MRNIIRRIYYLIKNIYINIKLNNVSVSLLSYISPGTKLSKFTKVGSYTYINGSVGEYTYIGQKCRMTAEIGKFCSISNNVKVVNSTHPTQFISTSPVFYSTQCQCGHTFAKKQEFDELLYIYNEEKTTCRIGNDVWIGENVLIKGGVTIGDGAIIGMGSIVTKDIPPYSIYAGIPAKEISKRFNEKNIKKLLEIKWWNKPNKWLEENQHLFISPEQFFNNIS